MKPFKVLLLVFSGLLSMFSWAYFNEINDFSLQYICGILLTITTIIYLTLNLMYDCYEEKCLYKVLVVSLILFSINYILSIVSYFTISNLDLKKILLFWIIFDSIILFYTGFNYFYKKRKISYTSMV